MQQLPLTPGAAGSKLVISMCEDACVWTVGSVVYLIVVHDVAPLSPPIILHPIFLHPWQAGNITTGRVCGTASWIVLLLLLDSSGLRGCTKRGRGVVGASHQLQLWCC